MSLNPKVVTTHSISQNRKSGIVRVVKVKQFEIPDNSKANPFGDPMICLRVLIKDYDDRDQSNALREADYVIHLTPGGPVEMDRELIERAVVDEFWFSDESAAKPPYKSNHGPAS